MLESAQVPEEGGGSEGPSGSRKRPADGDPDSVVKMVAVNDVPSERRAGTISKEPTMKLAKGEIVHLLESLDEVNLPPAGPCLAPPLARCTLCAFSPILACDALCMPLASDTSCMP